MIENILMELAPRSPILASEVMCSVCDSVFSSDLIETLGEEGFTCQCEGMKVTVTGDGYACARFDETGDWDYRVQEDNNKANLIRVPQEE